MKIKIDTAPGEPCLMISQTYIAISDNQIIGTTNLFNCLGIVIHSDTLKKGAVAHIQAEETSKYRDLTEQFIKQMMKYGGLGDASTLEIAFFGNGNGVGDPALFLAMLIRLGFANPNITDFRSGRQPKMQQIAPNMGQTITMSGTCIYDPKTGEIFIPMMNGRVAEAHAGKDTIERQIQDVDTNHIIDMPDMPEADDDDHNASVCGLCVIQ